MLHLAGELRQGTTGGSNRRSRKVNLATDIDRKLQSGVELVDGHSDGGHDISLNSRAGSLRFRHVSGYILDGEDPSSSAKHATGLDVLDPSMSKNIRHNLDFNFAIDNPNDKQYWETQNCLESCVSPTAPIVARVHGTPGYPIGVTVGLTYRLGQK